MDLLANITLGQLLYGLAALTALGAGAWLSIYAQGDRDRYEAADTQVDAHELATATTQLARRHVRAGPLKIDGPDGMATLTPLAPQRCAAIARLARATAANDFHRHGRRSASPYSRYSRAHVIYVIEYEACWEELEHGNTGAPDDAR
jgi:hypothetical protein